MKIKEHFLGHRPLYALIVIILIIGAISYVRFMIKNNYIISYEGACDPVTKVCFIGCEDDECTQTHYYAKMQKYAQDLYAECGADVVDCSAANECLPGDRDCSVTYCDNASKEEDECEIITEQSQLNNSQSDSIDTQL